MKRPGLRQREAFCFLATEHWFCWPCIQCLPSCLSLPESGLFSPTLWASPPATCSCSLLLLSPALSPALSYESFLAACARARAHTHSHMYTHKDLSVQTPTCSALPSLQVPPSLPLPSVACLWGQGFTHATFILPSSLCHREFFTMETARMEITGDVCQSLPSWVSR